MLEEREKLFFVEITILMSTNDSEANSAFSFVFGLYDFTNSRKCIPSHTFSHPILNHSLVRIHQQYISKSNGKAYLHTGFDFCVLVHNGKDGLHTTVFYQIRFVPNQYQRQPEKAGYIAIIRKAEDLKYLF